MTAQALHLSEPLNLSAPRPSTRALRRKFQTRSPLRTPLPALQEEISEGEQDGKWGSQTCSRNNVHKPKRRSSLDSEVVRNIAQAVQRDLPEMKRKVIVNPAA